MKFDNIIYLSFLKTLYVNFKCCQLRDAIKFPIAIARGVDVKYCKSNCFEFMGGGTGIVSIGFNRRFNKGSHSSLRVSGKVIVRGSNVHSFGAGCSIEVRKGAVLDIGDNFICTGDSYITVYDSIIIGENNLWSFNEVVMDTDSHFIYDQDGVHINAPKPIQFGDKVWLACNCLVLKGTKIPSKTVVAAGSTINKVMEEENTIVTSCGRVLRHNIEWSQLKK